ncbi:hypothetical protein SAMN02745121_05701 [Nannocystis exedens]|uniref:Uncharacterized protein n=1 Tax=Nannocystis exedens TaxID=54 RepID=A0A1I2DRH4_9BACT|nr:hypothetical protein [Nannocystis exedens]PCC68967.1 hypothetical protein NAEX_01988 [Nannocystis exedens]SFE82999.1 hypothetical protein SAMN02745121_05701 [Nannocystis exedens]
MSIDPVLARNWFAVLILLSTAVPACAPPRGDLGVYTDSDPADSTESAGTTTSGAPTSSGGQDGPEPASEAACAERTDLSAAWHNVVFDPDFAADDFAAACAVADLQLDPAHLSLDCAGQGVRIALGDARLSPVFAVGDEVAFDYRSLGNRYETWFTLRRPDSEATLLLAGVRAVTLAPAGAPDFFAPWTMTAGAGACPITPTCESPREKMAVEFSQADDAITVLPPSRAIFGAPARYELNVGTALLNHRDLPGCDLADFSQHNFAARIVLTPGP